MRYWRLLAVVGAALLSVRATPVRAQAGAATDGIVGRVTDSSSHAPIAQATVTGTSSANGITRTATPSNDGRYQLAESPREDESRGQMTIEPSADGSQPKLTARSSCRL